nr:hypothetical protein [uncultured Flavobacterium sp.]
MMKKDIFKIIVFVTCNFLFICCKTNPEKEFEKESDKLRKESNKILQKYLNENYDKFSDKDLHNRMDSITKIYVLDKNKELAIKFIETRKGIERINYLKAYISKEELKLILEKIPNKFANDTNYISIKQLVDKQHNNK